MPVCASAGHQPARAPIDFVGEIRDPFTLEKRERRVDGGGSSPVGDRVLIEISGGVADVRLNRPDKLNALDPAMFEAITAAGERLSRMAGLRAVVLTGDPAQKEARWWYDAVSFGPGFASALVENYRLAQVIDKDWIYLPVTKTPRGSGSK